MFRAFLTLLGILFIFALAGAGGILFIFHNYGRDLPEYQQLADYEPPVMTRVYAGDGRLLAEYAVEKRVFVPIKAMPKRVVQAFLAAEDKNFYTHPGIDVLSILRAALVNVRNMGTSKRPVGASTITQQVAKNFLLTNELSWRRKIQEAILAFRIERALSKDRILELYMNQIYLGFGSYGVAAAALNYFDKSMDDLTIAEAAFLAALPKAPNNYNPVKKPKAAKARRDWVIGRLLAEGYIDETEAAKAVQAELKVRRRSATEYVTADYFAEEVRRQLVRRFGKEELYKGGLSVRTTLDPALQEIADRLLREGLEAYDRRHGWRGPIARLAEGTRLDIAADWRRELSATAPVKGLGKHRLAVVIGLDIDGAVIGLGDGMTGRIPLAEMKWARPWKKGQKRGPKVTNPADVLAPGDVIAVDPVEATAKGKPYAKGTYGLRQLPDIEGALVAMDPHTGRVLAMAGGYSYARRQFNRATQAARQTGAAFKPFVYAAGLDNGFTPSSLVLDAPFVIDQGEGQGKWKPVNSSNIFYGPSTLRLGLEKSRNLMTVRLAQYLGPQTIMDYAARFGLADNMRPTLAAALGSAENTLLQMTSAYSMIVNGGYNIEPSLIERIQDRRGRTIYRHDKRTCLGCQAESWQGQPLPVVPDERKRVLDARIAYQLVSLMEGVIRNGTGRKIRVLGIPLGGKTGTTNDWKDAWFIGFSPDLVVGVFVGFDQPRSLGVNEEGSAIAVPIFRDFMELALKDRSGIPFRVPAGIRLIRINVETGLPAQPGDRNVILEAFIPGTEPSGIRFVLDGQGFLRLEDALKEGTSGIY